MEKKNVLYTEDDLGVRELVLIFFENYLPKVNLEIFKEGGSLEKRLQKSPNGIDLVITDNNMPCIHGEDIIKKYAKLPSFEKIPFILYYGGHLETGEQAIRDGAFAYLEKSESVLKLIPIVKRALKIG